MTSEQLERLGEALNAAGLSAMILNWSKRLAVWVPDGVGREGRVVWDQEESPRLAFAMLDVLESLGVTEIELTVHRLSGGGKRYFVLFDLGGEDIQVAGSTRTEAIALVLLECAAAGLIQGGHGHDVR